MLKKLYHWTLRLAESPRAEPALAAVSFAESSFFPIPPDVMLAPMMLARPDKAFRYALVCTMASAMGGLFGYAIGYFFFTTIGEAIFAFYGHTDGLETFREAYQTYGIWTIVASGLTPIPYKLITIASGAAQFNIWIFFVASFLTRGARFFFLALVLRKFGDEMREILDKRLGLITALVFVAIVLGFLSLKYVLPS